MREGGRGSERETERVREIDSGRKWRHRERERQRERETLLPGLERQ